jgi:predicted nucleic acid-binding protein
VIFCDTSYIAKLYVPERESNEVRQRLEAEDQVCISELARVELMGVFHRRLREAKWTRDDFQAASQQLAQDILGGFWTWLPLDAVIITAAAQTYSILPEKVFIRSADCLHLVTAIHHGFAEIHTFDNHQSAAAAALGIRAVAAI